MIHQEGSTLERASGGSVPRRNLGGGALGQKCGRSRRRWLGHQFRRREKKASGRPCCISCWGSWSIIPIGGGRLPRLWGTRLWPLPSREPDKDCDLRRDPPVCGRFPSSAADIPGGPMCQRCRSSCQRPLAKAKLRVGARHRTRWLACEHRHRPHFLVVGARGTRGRVWCVAGTAADHSFWRSCCVSLPVHRSACCAQLCFSCARADAAAIAPFCSWRW
mmetsp:Transcript_30815/g.79834  ORF Transcript_30815/g.79834 Transcript_30815/m.79834 type:complete len:219 (+) Transcript_30815:1237-1893(+)